eukprot:Gb_33292 [translate_table: standard]
MDTFMCKALGLQSLFKSRNLFLSPQRKFQTLRLTSSQSVWTLRFDGASKKNPGRTGAGGALCNWDHSIYWWFLEGLGSVSNNVAKFRALARGLKLALIEGVMKLLIQGDSELVCKARKGEVSLKHRGLYTQLRECQSLASSFELCQIIHILQGQEPSGGRPSQ